MTIRRARLAEIFRLRHAELRPGRPPAHAEFDGDEDSETVHVGAFDASGEIVGCATLMRRPYDGTPAAQLRGMATRADRARQGIGTGVLGFCEGLARDDWRVGLLWCNARSGAAGFYARLGWTVMSEPFDLPGIGPHVRMCRRLV